MICSSVNLDFFILPPPDQADSTQNWMEIRGSGHRPSHRSERLPLLGVDQGGQGLPLSVLAQAPAMRVGPLGVNLSHAPFQQGAAPGQVFLRTCRHGNGANASFEYFKLEGSFDAFTYDRVLCSRLHTVVTVSHCT